MIDTKPFAYIVRSGIRSAEGAFFMHRQRVFTSEHDQAQCARQWHEHFTASGLNLCKEDAKDGHWWEITKHTVYEADPEL